jgi:hypothetical protein
MTTEPRQTTHEHEAFRPAGEHTFWIVCSLIAGFLMLGLIWWEYGEGPMFIAGLAWLTVTGFLAAAVQRVLLAWQRPPQR